MVEILKLSFDQLVMIRCKSSYLGEHSTLGSVVLLAMYCSFVRTVRPGKHFLIETEDGDGELEDGPASDEDNQQNKKNNGEPITLNKSGWKETKSGGALRCNCLGGVVVAD